MRDRFIERLSRLAAEDPRIVLITGDLGFGVLTAFAERFPEQYVNAGVAEQNMTGLAVGMALEGRIVFTYSIGNFATLRCLEQIRNDACYHRANVKVVSIGGGFSYGPLGFSHHATEDLSVMRALPGIITVAPSCPWEAAEATEAVARAEGACYLRLDRSSPPETGREGERFVLGKARRIRDGEDLTLVACGGVLEEVLAAAERLAAEGVGCRVLSVHTLAPLDVESLASAAAETGGIVTVEENTVHGGLGGAVAETLLERGAVPKRFRRLGLRAGFCTTVGDQKYLRRENGLDAESIAAAARELLRA
ncbi:MAG TPA: transketolase C-terminal domain-containing protein [Longimicrobiales bacterium]|nr:transketolase C-terminal domain-containing protein [Longimicrobiales bacterium]